MTPLPFPSWLRYALIAAVDVEANFLFIKAYQYTTLTSIQILDCFSIPSVVYPFCVGCFSYSRSSSCNVERM